MKNFGSPGNILTLTAPTGGVTSGVPVIVGDLFAVPLNDADAGDAVACVVTGVIQDIAKTTGFSATAGDPAYWARVPSKVTEDTTDKLIGVFAADAASDDTTCDIRLNGVSLPDDASDPTVTVVHTTGNVLCTGSNNPSGTPKTYTYLMSIVAEGDVVKSWNLFAGVIDNATIDLSDGTFSLVFMSAGITGFVTIDTLVGPSSLVEMTELDPAYTVPDEGVLALQVAGIPDGTTIVFKADAIIN